MKVDDFLKHQDEAPLEFLAVVERSVTDAGRVRLTPYSESGGCSCDRAFELAQDAILDVEPLDKTVSCCGKQLRPARVRIPRDAHVRLADVFFESSAAAGRLSGSCDCEALFSWLQDLQEQLHSAPPNQKAGIVARIRKVLAKLEACGCFG
ncbi:MAG: hypothetical protein IPK82_09960 [Polyangiaceae bacterium]|nr:hypothetical protein [Polyangiaceae bacterium]